MIYIYIQPLTRFSCHFSQLPIPKAETLTAATVIDTVKTLKALKKQIKQTHEYLLMIKLLLKVL